MVPLTIKNSKPFIQGFKVEEMSFQNMLVHESITQAFGKESNNRETHQGKKKTKQTINSEEKTQTLSQCSSVGVHFFWFLCLLFSVFWSSSPCRRSLPHPPASSPFKGSVYKNSAMGQTDTFHVSETVRRTD